MPLGSVGYVLRPVAGSIFTETMPSGLASCEDSGSGGSASRMNSIHVSMGIVDPHSRLPTGLLLLNPAHDVATRSGVNPENQMSASLVVPVFPSALALLDASVGWGFRSALHVVVTFCVVLQQKTTYKLCIKMVV